MGEVYVRLDATAVGRSANALNTSEPTGGTGTTGNYWLRWNVNGFIGAGWFWNEPYSYLPRGWENAVDSNQTGCNVSHGKTENDFENHVTSGHVEDLNLVLGAWPDEEKTWFVVTHADDLNYELGSEPSDISCVSYV